MRKSQTGVHLVFEPPPDIDILFSVGEFGLQGPGRSGSITSQFKRKSLVRLLAVRREYSTPNLGESLRPYFQNARSIVISNSGHFVPEEQADALATASCRSSRQLELACRRQQRAFSNAREARIQQSMHRGRLESNYVNIRRRSQRLTQGFRFGAIPKNSAADHWGFARGRCRPNQRKAHPNCSSSQVTGAAKPTG